MTITHSCHSWRLRLNPKCSCWTCHAYEPPVHLLHWMHVQRWPRQLISRAEGFSTKHWAGLPIFLTAQYSNECMSNPCCRGVFQNMVKSKIRENTTSEHLGAVRCFLQSKGPQDHPKIGTIGRCFEWGKFTVDGQNPAPVRRCFSESG